MSWWERQLSNTFVYKLGEINTKIPWIDGKPIYRMMVDCGALPNATTKNTAHGITGVETYVDCYATAYNGTTNILRLPFAGGVTGENNVDVFVSSTNVSMRTVADYSAYEQSYAYIFYTKT